jgi:predicted nucleotidyltransferase component of viral defense system
MISKQDILDRAAEWQLQPHVVEKDYVLGWLLAGIASTSMRGDWIFKGGTCIKKCYLETYRFSEDLDFSLLPKAPYSAEVLTAGLRELAMTVTDLCGLTFPIELIEVRQRQNKQGQITFEGKLGYRGPLDYPGQPKVRFDFTRHEPVIEAPVARDILHPYPDELPENSAVQAYSFHELLAEKTRALAERSRPRDLYDVVHLIENANETIDLSQVRGLFAKKCASKAFPAPRLQDLVSAVSNDEELRSEWQSMLAHQLPSLPNLDDLLSRLPAVLAWVDDRAPTPRQVHLAPITAADPATGATPGIQFWGSRLPIEAIRFAGTNRLLLEFEYHGVHRVVEPYSIRQAGTGNLLLHAWEVAAAQSKSFKIDEIRNVRTSGRSFTPRFVIDVASVSLAPARTPAIRTRPSSHALAGGPKHVYRCGMCGKTFTHATQDPRLKKHKNKQGWDCSGRTGYLVTIRY